MLQIWSKKIGWELERIFFKLKAKIHKIRNGLQLWRYLWCSIKHFLVILFLNRHIALCLIICFKCVELWIYCKNVIVRISNIFCIKYLCCVSWSWIVINEMKFFMNNYTRPAACLGKHCSARLMTWFNEWT